MEEKKSGAELLEEVSFFGGLCLFLSAVEYAIPKPLPFLRLGLANLPIIISLKKFSTGETLLLIFVKIFMQALIGGTFFSYIFIFSLCGTLASGLIMLIAHRTLFKNNLISNIGLSLLGAMGNAFAQLLCTRFMLFGENTSYVAPLLLIFSAISGFLLGLFANQFEKKSLWFESFLKKGCLVKKTDSGADFEKKNKLKISLIFNILSAILLLVLLLISKAPYLKWIFLGLLFISLEIKKKGKVRILPVFFIVASVILSNLLIPFGKILFNLGKWRITEGALFAGLEKSAVLIGFLFFSQLILDRNISLPGFLGIFFKQTLSVFSLFSDEKITLGRTGKISGLVSLIDEKLMALSDFGGEKSGEEK